MEEPSVINNWKRISILGSGAFGVVSLWKDEISQNYLAIKKCKFQTTNALTDRQRKRWENEVQIMKNLSHPNLVSFQSIPEVLETALLKSNPSKLPLLSMEYCRKGNLRHVLMQPKNVSGLQESEIRIILEDISNAVAYLHKLKITHRDIKPDNIVLQDCKYRKDGVIYKLIDLGYAKELNDSIVSFVGTLHYLAPEIFKTEAYNHSVDYWSLGILTFEIICGVLPFLPLCTPFERFPYIEKKKPEHICIYKFHSGSISYSSEILKENYISSCLKQNLEVWLRHVLQFDPILRSANFPDDTNVFENMQNLLKKKFVNIFSVYTLEFYTYEIKESTLVSTLKTWIARDTKVHSNEVFLTNLENKKFDDYQYVMDFLHNNRNSEETTLFIFKMGTFINQDQFILPKYIRILFENCTQKYTWRELRPLYSKALFYLMQEDKLIKYVKRAFNLCFNYLKERNSLLSVNLQQVYKEVNDVLLKHKCYLSPYNKIKSSANIIPKEYLECLLNFNRLSSSLERSVSNTNKLISKVDILIKRQVILNDFHIKVSPVIEVCDIQNQIAEAICLLSKGNSGSTDLYCKQMAKTVSDAIKSKDYLMNNKRFENFSTAISVAILDVETLLNWMEEFRSYIADLSKAFDDNHAREYQLLLASFESIRVESCDLSLSNIAKSLDHAETDGLINENKEMCRRLEDAMRNLFS